MSLGNLVDSKYPAEGIEEVLDMYFGETMLSEALTNVIIPSYELEQRMPFFLNPEKQRMIRITISA